MDLRSLPRWLGWLWVIAGGITVLAAFVGAVVGWSLVGSAAGATTDSVALTRDVLVTVADSTEVVDDVFDDVAGSLRGMQGTLSDASLTLTRAAAVTSDLSEVVTEQVPASIESVSAALPGLIDTAGLVDTAMRGLSFFGVDYDADVPLDTSIAEIEARLVDIPVLLRAQQTRLEDVAGDLGSFASTTLELSDDLGGIRSRLRDAEVVLDDYAALVEESTRLVDRLEADVLRRADTFRVALVLTALGVGISQTAPIAIGVAVLGRESDDEP